MSIHIPFVPILGVLYFMMKFSVDCHLLLNLYKSEIESSGRLIHNACLKAIFALAFFQFCMMLRQLGGGKFVSGLIILVIFIFTIAVYILYSDRFLRPELFNDEEFRMDKEFIRNWRSLFSHPLTREAESVRLPVDRDFQSLMQSGVSQNSKRP